MYANMIQNLSYYSNMPVKHCSELEREEIDFYELTLVLSGSMTYYSNEKKIVLEKDDAVFLTPGTLRRREESKNFVHYISFNFLPNPNIELNFEKHLKKVVNEDIRRIISVYHLKRLSHKYHSTEKCQNILNYILLEILDMQSFSSKNDHVINILKYVDDHITEKLSLKDIAKEFHMSNEYTSYIFKKETGKQLTQYINEQKTLLAKKLILNEGMSLAEISFHLGFENYDYFSKTFKKYAGISPSQFKRNSFI